LVASELKSTIFTANKEKKKVPGAVLVCAGRCYKENAVTEFERVNENTARYAEACKDVARQLGVPVVDLFTKIQQRPNWEGLLRSVPSHEKEKKLHTGMLELGRRPGRRSKHY